MLTASQIIDQAMDAGGNTRITTWCLRQLNIVLRELYRKYEWPFLEVTDESLSTTASQAYTSYAALTDLWRPQVVQIRSGTSLYEVTPKPGGLSAYYADTGRLAGSGRPSKYVLDRRNRRIYWADSIPSAAETISLLYQAAEDDEALGDTPTLVTHTKNGELYLYYRLLAEIKFRQGEAVEATAMLGRDGIATATLNALLGERLDDQDRTPEDHGNTPYV